MLMYSSGMDNINCCKKLIKSRLVNSFIKDLVKVECEDLGVKSKAKRTIEFRGLLTVLNCVRKKDFD